MEMIGVLGTGNMGRAIIGGILGGKLVKSAQISCFDRDKRALNRTVKEYSVRGSENARKLIEGSAVLLLAVKPQNLNSLSPDVEGIDWDGKLVISILAGKKVKDIQETLGNSVAVVRAMPNTPCLIGKGVTGLFSSKGVSKAQKKFALEIFSSTGTAAFFEKEELIDVVTGFTGSGPAFIFVLIEALADGAVKCGIPRDRALTFATSLVEGSASLVRETGIHPEKLKEMVMSPGGTTAEGVSILEKRGFRGIIIEAIDAAYRKPKSIH